MMVVGENNTNSASTQSSDAAAAPSSSSLFHYYRHKVVVVTGGGSGIGKALVYAFANYGARCIVVDRDGTAADAVARTLDYYYPPSSSIHTSRGGSPQFRDCATYHFAYHCDVSDAPQVRTMIASIKARCHSGIDIYCSNAGIIHPPKHDDDLRNKNQNVAIHTDEEWMKILQINLLSHVIAARELLPEWTSSSLSSSVAVARKTYHPVGGDSQPTQNTKPVMVVTASAAGLLTQIGDASYGVSKAGVISFAEHLAITHGSSSSSSEEDGRNEDNHNCQSIQVHCLCPQAVRTPFLHQLIPNTSATATAATTATTTHNTNSALVDGMLSPETVADCTIRTIANNPTAFYIFPHPQVSKYVQRKARNHTRWIQGMQQLRRRLMLPPQQQQTKRRDRVRSKL